LCAVGRQEHAQPARAGGPELTRYHRIAWDGAKIEALFVDLFADRSSAATMRANQLRLWFASMACVLLCALRRIALQHTQFAKATCGTIRLKLLKIGALVRTSVRRIKFAMASGCLYQRDFARAHAQLINAAAR
jgi:hypothetical protein